MTKRSRFTFLGFPLVVIGLLLTLTPYLLQHPTFFLLHLVIGLLLTLTPYFLRHATFLTALGASILILAFVSIALGAEQPGVSPDINCMLSDAGLINTALLIRGVGPASKAIYLPSSFNGGEPRVLLQSPGSKPMPNAANLGGMMVQPAPSADTGILITTLGSLVVERFAPLRGEDDLEGVMSPILVGLTDLAEGVKIVEAKNALVVEVTNPRIRNNDPKIFERVGSPLASVVASAIAEVKGKPVEILHEAQDGRRYIIEIGFVE